MITKLHLVVSKSDKISRKEFTIKGSNTIAATIRNEVAAGFKILFAIAEEWHGKVGPINKRVIPLTNYNQ